jgi:flagellar biogenesis protein FliO
MSFWVQLAVMSAVMVTILGIFLAIYWIFTKRMLKEEARATRELLDRMEQRQSGTRGKVA